MAGGPEARPTVQIRSTTAAREATFPGMCVFVTSLILSLALSVPPAVADDALPPPSDGGRGRLVSIVPTDGKAELDTLFVRLAAARDRAEAGRIETDIRSRWSASGSATADLMLGWTAKAVESGDAAAALDLLDELTVREPGFAEAYYRRATLHLLSGRLSPALGDLQTVLRIEPRHFLAIKELADVFEQLGDSPRALSLLKRLQVIDKHFDGLDEAIEAIVAGSHGRDI